MAVAVKNSPETSTKKLLDHLAVASLAGTVYVAAGLALVFAGIPAVWEMIGMGTAPVSYAARVLVQLAVLGGLVVVGARALAAEPRPGLKAGIFFGLVGLVFATWLTSLLGTTLLAGLAPGAGLAAVLLLFVGQLAGIVYLFSREGCQDWLVTIEEQGWFDLNRYKPSQGMRVRRGTMLGILVLGGSGVYTLLSHETLATGPVDLLLPVPFIENLFVLLLPDVRFTLPLLLSALTLWFAYRVVNLPVFADFLIATEAEMNKVSWTTRKRLVQDTIVVLVTVVLFTVFLFAVDQLWIFTLRQKWLGGGILRIKDATEQTGGGTDKELPW